MRVPGPGPWALRFAALVGALTFPLAPLVGYASTRAYTTEYQGRTAQTPEFLDPLLTFAPPGEVYAFYGGLWPFAFAAFLLAALHLRAREAARLPKGGRLGLRLLLVGLPVAIAGTIGDYWLGRDVLGQIAWGASFVVTMLGVLACMTGSVLLGRGVWASRRAPRPVAVAFLLAPAGFLVNAFLIPNAPAAFVPPLALGWIALSLAPNRMRDPAPAPAESSE